MPTLRQWSMAFCALAITSSRLPPAEARAPPIFHMKISPATPPTFSACSLGGTGYIIVGDNGLYCQPLLSSHFYCHFNIQIVSGVIPVQTSDALPAIRRVKGIQKCSGSGGGTNFTHGSRINIPSPT